MKRAFLVLAILALCASGALAVTMPSLVPTPPVLYEYSPGLFIPTGVTYSQTGGDIDFTIPQTVLGSTMAYGAAVGVSPVGDNYTTTTTLHFSDATTEIGLFGRGNLEDAQVYEASFNPNNKYLALVRINNATSFSNLATKLYDAFDINKDYTLQLTIDGSSLRGDLFDGSTVVARVTANDSTYSTGYMGVIELNHGTSGMAGQFLNSTITLPVPAPALPEPGTVVSLLAGTLSLLGWRFLRRR
jgi:hypothetical protein